MGHLLVQMTDNQEVLDKMYASVWDPKDETIARKSHCHNVRSHRAWPSQS